MWRPIQAPSGQVTGAVSLRHITGYTTKDKQNGALRECLGAQADFVGAIRLPSDAFKREGTAVVTDIVFLRKRAPGEPARHEEAEWHRSRPMEIDGEEVSINRYFVRHPEMVLGQWSRKDTLYGEGYSVVANGDLPEQLNAAIERLPSFARTEAESPASQPALSFTLPRLGQFISEGSFVIRDDRTICQMQQGTAMPVTYGGTKLRANGTLTGKRIASLIRIRDAARRVLESQNEGWSEPERKEARRELNWAYDSFVGRYGPVNKTTFSSTADGTSIRRMPNLVKFREDPDAMLVMSLEHYDEQSGKATKAAIMSQDVVGRSPPVTHVESAEEGLLVSLNERGEVDLAFIASLYGKTEEAVLAELGDLVFHDPQKKTWQTADAYLSGNVRAKLAAAKQAGEAYARNAEALRRVQPEDVLPGDIDANLGAPWIPEGTIQSFAAELFKVEPAAVSVAHLSKEAVWSLEADYAAKASVAATSDYGTARANGTWLLELALNMKTPVVYDPDPGDAERRVVNQDETFASREKQKLIKERFRAWAFIDPDRTERLVRLYNDTYNNLRPRLFDGSHLTFPGINQTISLRPHQKAAVWRGMSAGNTLLAHAGLCARLSGVACQEVAHQPFVSRSVEE
jgi:N12 class adenine-specific DNA methylase